MRQLPCESDEVVWRGGGKPVSVLVSADESLSTPHTLNSGAKIRITSTTLNVGKAIANIRCEVSLACCHSGAPGARQ